ncbi:unknown [Clostridium sp. CAG:492]|nr:unknown [Clostridium sp. CAG:492]
MELKDLFVLGFNHDVGYIKRLEDIKSRYGENSTTYKNAKTLILNLRSENQC